MYNIKVSIKDMTTLLAALQHYTLDLKDDPIRQQSAALNLNIGEQVLKQSEPVLAFDKAIKAGVFSESNAKYYMYMGTDSNGKAQFKHSITREYIKY